MTISERVAYLKGLCEGMNIEDANYAKLFSTMTDILQDIALELEEDAERLDVLDEDLANVEDIVYDLDDDEWDDEWDDEEDDDEEDGTYEFECPNCHQTVYFDDSIFEDDDDFELECPACGAKLDSLFELDDDEDNGSGDDDIEF